MMKIIFLVLAFPLAWLNPIYSQAIPQTPVDDSYSVITTTNADQIQEIEILELDAPWVSDMKFHPSGEFLAIVETASPYDGYRGLEGKVSIFGIPSWDKVKTLIRENSSVISLAFEPDGTYIAVGNTAGEIQLWNWQFSEVDAIVQAHNTWVNSLSFESGGGGIISGSGAIYSSSEVGDSTVIAWNTNPLEEFIPLVPENAGLGASWAVTISPVNGIRLVGMTDGHVRMWGSESNIMLAVLDGYTNTKSILFTSDGEQILFPSYDGIHIWSVRAAIRSFGYVPEYQLIAPILKPDAPLEEREFILSIALSPDDSVLAAGYHDGAIRLWDMETGERLMVLEGHEGYIPSLTFSPDGTLLASGGADGTVRLWGIPASE